MATEVFLIDYENVQPDVLPALALKDAFVILFVGPHQSKLPLTLINVMQKFGRKGQYIQIEDISKNNLDMHLAFHMGRLLHELPNAFFHIISKDHDYNLLLKHINHAVERSARSTTLEAAIALNLPKTNLPTTVRKVDKKIDNQKIFENKDIEKSYSKVIECILLHKRTRPKTQETLSNWLTAHFSSKKLNKDEIAEVIERLKNTKILRLKGSKVIYMA